MINGKTMWTPPTDSPEEAHRKREAALLSQGERELEAPPRDPTYDPPAPLAPEKIDELIRDWPCDANGKPLEEKIPRPPDAEEEKQWQREDRERRDRQRLEAWRSLSIQHRTQRKADKTWGDEDYPLWDVAIPHSPDQPLIALRAPTAVDAEERYRWLCGILSCSDPARVVAVPHVQPDAA
jgi:hypothetical protein